MPRRRSPEKRKVLPDPKYKDVVLAKFMNNLMNCLLYTSDAADD